MREILHYSAGILPGAALAVLLLLLPGYAFAQADYPYLVDQHPFIRYADNHLEFPGSRAALDPLFAKMDRVLFAGEGQVNVVHIGGSHIQADMWSDRMRQRLQTFFPGVRGARGMLFPFRMAKTNNPWNYRPEYTGNWTSCRNVQRKCSDPLGLTGMAVTTYDSLATLRIFFRGDSYPRYQCNRIRVFHDQSSANYPVRMVNAGPTLRVSVNRVLGYTEFRLDTFLTEVEFIFAREDSSQTHFTLYGISLENDDPGFVYHAIGVNGAATGSYLRCQLFGPHLKAVRPDLLVFSIGINDANTPAGEFNAQRYERNYDSLVTMARAANPDAAILFTTNNDSYYRRRYANRNAYEVRKVMRRLAKKHDAVVWDMFGVMGGLGSIRKWIRAGLANKDRIHLLKPGYVLLADLMFNALMEPYDAHLQKLHQQESGSR
ncbi:MAG: GDSL-type esterase/lipase family protein [Bacteroidota bacterium]